MPNTMELLNRALAAKKAIRWCEEMGLDPSAITHARKRGKLSPTMAAHMAMGIDEDPIKWAAIAGIEGDTYNPELKVKVMSKFETAVALYLDASFSRSTRTTKQGWRKTRRNHTLCNGLANTTRKTNRFNCVATLSK